MASARLRFDHTLVAVFDLAAAKSEFEALGFTVISGGQHSGGLTENALVTFADGNYLELIAPTSLELLDRPPQPGGRRRPDGVKLAWRTAMLPDTRSPFFLTDDTPRDRRVREDFEITTHPNGAVGVIGIVIPVENLERAVAWHEVLLGVPSRPGSSGVGTATAEFQIGGFGLTLAEPEGKPSPLADHLARRGQVPYQVRIRTTNLLHVAGLEARGARIELVQG